MTVEQAKAFRRLMDLNGWSARPLAREMHIPDANIVRALALLNLPESVQEQVETGRLAPSVAYEVRRLDTPKEQVALAERVVTEKLMRGQAVESAQAKKPGRAGTAKRVKEEVQRDDGSRITIAGPAAAAGQDAIVAALKWALKQATNCRKIPRRIRLPDPRRVEQGQGRPEHRRRGSRAGGTVGRFQPQHEP